MPIRQARAQVLLCSQKIAKIDVYVTSIMTAALRRLFCGEPRP